MFTDGQDALQDTTAPLRARRNLYGASAMNQAAAAAAAAFANQRAQRQIQQQNRQHVNNIAAQNQYQRLSSQLHRNNNVRFN